MYLVQSAVVSYPKLEEFPWIPFFATSTTTRAVRASSNGTLESIEQYYANNNNKNRNSFSDGPRNRHLERRGKSISMIKKSPSDEWGHFTEIDDNMIDIGELNPIVPSTATASMNNNAAATALLGTLHEEFEEDDCEDDLFWSNAIV